MSTTMTKKQTIKSRVADVRELMATNDAALEDALLTIYAAQTTAEQNSETTLEDNGVGFSGADAELLSSFAKQIINNRATRGVAPGKSLSAPHVKDGKQREGQIGWARRKMMKYARQLVNAEWTYTGPTGPDVEPKTFTPVVVINETRLDQLKDAVHRIGVGRDWITNNEEHEDQALVQKAKVKLARLLAYAEQLVTDATSKDLADDDFRRLARIAKPCSGCNGSGRYYGSGAVVNGRFEGHVGPCFRCGSKGFQTDADERRNAHYDNHVRSV